MDIIKTYISGLYILKPNIIIDNRGYFFESYNKKTMQDAKLSLDFIQENQSLSKKGVIRGMHIQKDYPTGKLIQVVQGYIWDVVVDLRKKSETYGKWYGIELSATNKKQLYIPKNFAHGFLTLSKKAVVLTKVTDHYHPGDEIGFAWNDPEVGIKWPIKSNMNIILAKKDKNRKSLSEMLRLL